MKIDAAFRQGTSKAEGFTVKYPNRISDKPVELRRDGGEHLIEMEGGASLKGQVQKPQELDCILLWNEEVQSYEIKPLGFEMVATPIRERPTRPALAQSAKSHVLRAPSRVRPQIKPRNKIPAKENAVSVLRAIPREEPTGVTQLEKRETNDNRPTQAPVDEDDFDGLAEAIADELDDEPQNSKRNAFAIGTSGYAATDDGPTSEEE